MSGSFPDPEARADYSSNPSFRDGAGQTPHVELLLQPELADAMNLLIGDLVLYNHGQLKFKPVEAEQIIANLEVARPHLERQVERQDPHNSGGPWERLSKMEEFVTQGLETHKAKARYLDARRQRRETESQVPEAIRVTTRFLTAVIEGEPNDSKRLQELRDAYHTDPSILPTAFEVCNELAETVQQSTETPLDNLDWRYYLDATLRNAFASFQFPDLDNPNFTRLLNSLDISVGEDASSILLVDGEGRGPAQAILSRDSIIVARQLVNTIESTSAIPTALKFADRIYKYAFDHNHEPAGANLITLYNQFKWKSWTQVNKVFTDTGIGQPVQRNKFYRFTGLLARGFVGTHIQPDEYPYVENGRVITHAVTGRHLEDKTDTDCLIMADNMYGTDYLEHYLGDITRKRKNGDDEVQKRGPLSRTILYKAIELAYDKNWHGPIRNSAISPRRAQFSVDKDLEGILANMLSDYKLQGAETPGDKLVHRGYWETVARFMPGEYSDAEYSALRKDIEDFKAEIYVDGDYFLSPQGDQFKATDKQLRKAGFNNITFRKHPKDHKYTEAILDFNGAKIGLVITPEMEIANYDFQPMELLENRHEPLLYLVFGYLRAIKCQTPDVRPHSSTAIRSLTPDPSFVRRAHMRRLREGENPGQRQIDLAMEHEDFDVVEDNMWRKRHGLPIRTYVEQTIVDPENAKPMLFKAPKVERDLLDKPNAAEE